MMSSEEDPDMSLLEDNKGKASKTKRVRQRVDAGEPRNSYASIPNFSSRPPQGTAALFHHPHANGFNASKMLCDLLGSSGLRNSIGQAKSEQEIMVLDAERNASVNGSSPLSRMFVNGGDILYGRGPMMPPDSPERCSSAESTNSHLLRDILQQGRQASKARGAETSGGHGRESPNCSGSGTVEKLDDEDSNESTGQCRMSAATAARESPATCARSPCGSSPGSSPRNPSTDAAWSAAEHNANLSSNPPSSSLEVKRARVETIVNNMLQGPVPGRNNGSGSALGEPQPPVNGCKKRKLYQPQQHESTNRTPVNGDSEIYDDYEEFDDVEGSPASKRRAGNSGLFTFRQQLRQMQQQLVAMQQQYMEMVDGDSTDEEMPPQPPPNNPTNNDRPRSTEISDCEDMKPRIDSKPPVSNKSRPPSFVDYDNASMYDEQRRLIIDDSKEPNVPSNTGTAPKSGLQELRQSCIVQPSPCPSLDYEWLAESLKAELSTSLSQVVDAVVSRCVRKNAVTKSMPSRDNETPKDPTLLSQMLDRKSPRTGKVIDRGTRVNGHGLCGLRTSPYPPDIATAPKPPFFFPLKPPASVAATAAFLYGSPPQLPPLSLPQPYVSSPASSTPTPQDVPEQTEAMSLVVTPKKKRHKVTDTRLNQRGQLCGLRSSESSQDVSPKYNLLGGLAPQEPLAPSHLYSHHPPPPPLVPVSLPTTVAIPNPSLNQSELFHNFSYDHHRLSQHFLEPPEDDSGPPVGPLHHSGPLHPLLPFHGHQRGSPDSLHLSHMKQDSGDLSDTGDSPAAYDPGMAMISFLRKNLNNFFA